jgi:glycosyltransferase involved in cell wall biosynthesis
MKVSVAMCSHNGAAFLREQLDSLLAQSRPPDELIVCDDASTDGTAQILETFSRRATFPVRLSVNYTKLGTTRNFENAINACSGDLIFLCDQDDVWHPDKIEVVEQTFQTDPRIGLVFSDAELVDQSLNPRANNLFAQIGFEQSQQELVRTGRVLELCLRGNYICGATMGFRSVFKSLVLPMPNYGPLIHDGWIGLMVAAVAGVTFIDRPLIKYRQHAAQQVGSPRATRLEGIMRAKRTARMFYVTQAEQLQEALARLVDYGIDARQELLFRQKIIHLNQRAGLPKSQLRRASSISKEILSRRYHRFSQGWFSAAKDLFM